MKFSWDQIKKYNILFVLLMLGVSYFFFFYYIVNPWTPGVNETFPIGYFGWWDQSRYLLMAQEIAAGDLVHYDYGLGYPLVAVPFIHIFSQDPFLVPNLLLWMGIIIFMYFIAQILFKNSTMSIAATLLFIFATNIMAYIAVPWNSTVVLFANLLIVYLGLLKKRTLLRSLLISFLLVWIFSTRYIDIIFSSILALLYFKDILLQKNWKHIIGAFSIGVIGIFLILYTHKVYFGGYFKTPYVTHLDTEGKGISDQDLRRYSLGKIPISLKGVMIGIQKERHHELFKPLLGTSFYFVLVPVGLLWVVLQKKQRILHGIIASAAVLSILFYASFPAFVAEGIKYGTLHYIKTWIPFFVIYVMYAWNFFLKPDIKNKENT